MLTGLAPLVSVHTRLLVLGSFPGVASLAAQQYYGHPQNHFWKILHALWPGGPMEKADASYAARCHWMLDRGLGVWDVYAACERSGSLDSNIRSAVVNDFSSLVRDCPGLQAIAHNGSESFRHARHTQLFGLPVHRLPSTSPANARWSFAQKLAAWQSVFEQHGLLDRPATGQIETW